MSTVMERSSEASGDMSTQIGAHVGIGWRISLWVAQILLFIGMEFQASRTA